MVKLSSKRKILSLPIVFIVLFSLLMGSVIVVINPKVAHASGGVTYYTKNDGTNFYRSSSPFTSGVATQTANSNGSVTASVNSAPGYADSGYVMYESTLGSLPNFTVTGTGDHFGLNLWFDVNNNNEFFAWDSNGELTGLDGDTYALSSGSSSGSLTVNGSTSFYVMSDGQNHSLSDLKNGSVSGISSSTKVAIWIGVNTDSSGGSISATTQINPSVNISNVYSHLCVESSIDYSLSGFADSYILKRNGTQIATLDPTSTHYTDTIAPPWGGGQLNYEIDAIVNGSVYASSVDPQNYPACPAESISSVFTYGCITSVISYSLTGNADTFVLRRNGTQIANLDPQSTQYTDDFTQPWPGGQLNYEIDAYVNGSLYSSVVNQQYWAKCPQVSISSVFTYGCVTSVVYYSLGPGADSYILKRNGTQVATLDPSSTQYTDNISPPWPGGQLNYEVDAIVNGSVYWSSVNTQTWAACS